MKLFRKKYINDKWKIKIHWKVKMIKWIKRNLHIDIDPDRLSF